MTDTFLADFDADRARRRNQSVGRAQEAITLNSSTAPAQVSRAQRDAQLLGIPTASVLGDPMFSAEAKAKRDSEYLAQAPAAARWLADDDNAAVAHDQVEQLSTLENILAGVGSRALNLGAGLGRGILTAIDKPADYLQERFPTPLVGVENGRFTVRQGTAADAAAVGSVSVQNTIRRGEQATLGYVAGTSWEDVKRQPVQSIIPFALEQGIVSVPDMVAAVVNLPAYISARTGEIGQTRAENDGREDATVEDLVTALPVASASALLERFATRGLLGMGSPVRTIGQVPGAVVRSTLREGTTEAAQEAIESAGETVGTQRGFSVFETADRALAGFVGGAPFGGAVRAVTAPVEVAVQRRQAAQAAEGQAAAFDEKRQAVLASPLRELVPERFRDYLRMASPPDAQVIVPGEAVVSFFQSNPDLDRWMDEWDIRDQVEQAAVAGTDVVFDQGTYLGSVVGTQADTAWARDLKFGDKAMSVNEAVEAEAEGEQELADVFARAVGAGESVQAVQSAYDRVQSDIKAKLRETGMGEQEARYAALLSADRYASRSEREGYADAWEAYQADGGVNFRQSLPPSVQAQKDRLDLVVAAMKSRDTGPTQRQLYGDSLLEFVSANGGIEDTGGDLASMDAAAWSNPRVAGRVGRRSIIRRPGSEPGAFGPDEVLTRAIEAGYFRDDASVNDLFEAVRGELAGQNRFSDSFARNNRTEETIQAADELADLLTKAGIDPQQASNEEIRAFVDGMGVEGGSSDVRASDPRILYQSEVSGLTEDQYIERINPEGRRIAEGDRPNLGMGDMYGMAPKGARQIATMQDTELGRVRIVESGGDVYALANNPDLGEEDVVGYMIDRDGSTELAVVSEAQGKGIGAELSYQFRSRSPFAQSGGLTEAGEATARAAYRRMTQEGRTLYQSSSESLSDIVSEADARGVRLSVSEPRDNISVLSMIDTREAGQGEGIGSEIMGRLTAWADRSGVTLALTPEKVGNTSKARLTAFYKRQGFVENKGRSRDFATRESMIRAPQETFNQNTPMSGPRGEIVFREAGATITFFKARDRSTFIHEMGHKWLDELIIDAARPAATEQTKADLQTVMDWFSKEAGETITAENFGVDQHELWARGWERYLMEGVSPSLELRAVFSRFADWIKRIYKNVANLNAPISNPVRDVMSRMIATDDQLASVREVQNLNRIFGDAKAGNMTKAEFEALTKADNDAWEASRERAYKAVMEPLRREATAAWEEERETLRDGQTAKVDAMPDVAALRFLEETGERLNRKAMIDQAGTKEVLKLLPNRRPAIYSNDGVWHPDALAVEVGVANGDQLINALMEHEQERQNRRAQGDMRSVRDARIEDAMDAEMRFLNDDPLTDGRLETLANIAVHEKLKAKSLAMEATQLSKLAGRNALWTEEGIEAYARDTISNLRAVKINPSQYLRAERSAGFRAQRALLKKDYAKALDAKLVQVVNFQLYRSAIDAQEEVAKAEKLFSKVVRAKDQAASKSRNFDMVNAAREILAAYGLTRKSGQDASAYMAAVAQYDPDAYAALKETIDTAVEVAAPLDQLSLQDFRELTEVIDQLWNLSRRTQVMEIEGRRVELQTARGEIVGDLTANRGARPGKRGLDKAVTQKERLMSDLLSIRSYLGKVEEWAMRQGPAFTKYIYRPVSQGADGYRTLLREHMPKLEAALKTLRPDIEKPFKIDAREIGYTFGHDGGNGVIEIIGAMRHMGNASNYRKLILGRGWGTKNPDGSLDDTAFQAMMSRLQSEGVIQKRHWDYVQAEWDLHDEIKPHVQRAHRRMTGRYFEEITANAVETPFGIYKGGYVPAKVDPALDPRAAEFDLQGILANGTNGSFVWPGPANGFTKGRVEYNKPLDLDLRKALSQFDEAMKYAMIGPAVQDVTRLLRDTEFAEVMNDYDQGVWNDFLQPWLVRAVSQRVTEPSDHPLMRRVEGAMSFVTRRTGAMIMFANVVNAAQQFTGFFPAMIRTGKVNMATALRDYVKNPAGMADKVAASSAFMANRLGSEMRDLSIEANRIKLAPGPYGRAAEWTERHAYFLQKGVQNMMDPIVWTAAYNRATERGEENPVAYADMVIRTTQDSYNAEDATKFATGSKFAAPFKMFSGYFIGQANLISTEVTIAAREKNYGRIAEIYTLGIFITAVGSEVIAQGLRGELGDEDDDGWWDDLADVFLISQLRYAAAFIPFVGQGVNALIGALDDKPYNDRLSLSPIVSTGEAVVRTVPNTINVIQGDADASRTVKDYSTVISLATGLPTFQRQTGYVADVLEGDVEPVGPVDAARGFISGRASEESRTD